MLQTLLVNISSYLSMQTWNAQPFQHAPAGVITLQHRPFVQHAISPQHAALRSITTTYIIITTLYFFSPRHALYFISLQCTLANACFINTCSTMPWYALSTCTNTTTYSNITACINYLKISLHCGQRSCLDLVWRHSPVW